MMQQLDIRQPISVADKLLCASVEAQLGPRQRAKVRGQLSAIIAAGEGGQEVMTRLAGMCLEDGDTEAGAEWTEALRRLAPDALPTLKLQARLAVARGDRDAARQVLTKLLSDERIAAGDTARGLDTAAFAAELGFTADADRLLVALEEKSPQAVLARARSLGKRQMAAEATALVAKVREKVPPMQLLQTLVEILLTSRDEAAVESIIGLAEAVCREEEGSPDIALQQGIILSVAGQTERAMTIFSDLLASGAVQGARKGLVQANLAFLLAKPSTAEEAGRLIDEAIDELGPQPDLLDTRAVIRHARGQTSLALQDMADVVIKPTAQHYLHLASIQADAGDLDGARTAYGRSIELGLEKERLLPDDLLRKLRLEVALGGK